MRRSWTTSPAIGAAAADVAGPHGASERRGGASEVLGGASEVWRLGASELRLRGASELLLRGTVATIADAVDDAGLRQAAVILVGRALDPRAGGESYLYDAVRERRPER